VSSPLLAACAALAYSLSQIFVRLGSRSVLPLSGVVLSLGSSVLVLITALTIRGGASPSLTAVAAFAMGGLLGPGLGRILSITAISRIGATRASPVKAAAQPVVAVMLGVLVLSETLEPTRVLGIFVTLGGVLIVVRSGQRTPVPTGTETVSGEVRPPIVRSLKVLFWPLGAGTAFATADLVRKSGMQIMDDAVFGGSVGVAVALSIWATVLVTRGQGSALVRDLGTPDSKWFLASGMASGAAQVFMLSALRDGDLSLVGPIVSIQPILIALISRVFIQRLEKVGIAVIAAAVMAVAGTILISR
jgi:drug/metabolite transporter (DMT)-like permease